MTTSQNKRAFTLVELLVVIAIITVLISILLPALNRAREAARSIVCLSNLRQCHLGILYYGADNNNWYPVEAATSAGAAKGWSSVLVTGWNFSFTSKTPKPYLTRKVVVCPSNDFYLSDLEHTAAEDSAGGDIVAYASLVAGNGISSTPPELWNISRVLNIPGGGTVKIQPVALPRFPGSTIMLADSLSRFGGPFVGGVGHMYACFYCNSSSGSSGRIHVLHDKGLRFNAMFYDGHAESLTDRQAYHETTTQCRYFYSKNGTFYHFTGVGDTIASP